MNWLRQAGGLWVNPQDPQRGIPVDSHAPYAMQVLGDMVLPPDEAAALTNQYISELEQKKQTVVVPDQGEEKIDYKGTGGEEAKAQAEQMVADERAKRLREQYNVTSPLQAANVLSSQGWVRINLDDAAMVMVMAMDDQSVLNAEDVILAEAMKRDLLTIYIGNEMLSIMPATITTNLADAMAKARSKKQPAQTSSGLGPWRIAGADRVVSFSAPALSVVHKPANPVGRQWCVVNTAGKVVAEGASRKWADRTARKNEWQRRKKA